MNDLTIEDFKQVLLDLYLVQRENAALHAQLHKWQTDEPAPEKAETEA